MFPVARPAVLDDLDWPADALDWLWAASGLTFTADDMRKCLRPAPTPNQVGAAFKAASRMKLIGMVDAKQSTTKSRNGGLIRVWQGTIEGVTK